LGVLGYEEVHFGDLKAKELKPAKMSESVSAFANADGGELWIGIHENSAMRQRSWNGFLRIEDANAHIGPHTRLKGFKMASYGHGTRPADISPAA
jgi:predicted HTH transcriptional regulator